MILSRHNSIQTNSPGLQVFLPRTTEVVVAPSWYLVAGKTCEAAYQFKGAASQSASYVNLTSNAAFNATTDAAPAWDAGVGLTFDGTTQYLNTNCIPAADQSWSWIIAFNTSTVDSGYRHICGNWDAAVSALATCSPCFSQDWRLYRYHNYSIVSAAISAGVMCVAGTQGYLNGNSDGDPLTAGSATLGEFYIGAANINIGYAGDSPGGFTACNVTAFAMYSAILSGAEAATVSAAMALL